MPSVIGFEAEADNSKSCVGNFIYLSMLSSQPLAAFVNSIVGGLLMFKSLIEIN